MSAAPPVPDPGPPAHAATAAEVLAALGVETARGLDRAQIAERRARHGANRLAAARRVSPAMRLVRQFTSLVIVILLVAAALSFAVGERFDAAAILAIVFLNAILGFVQEERAARALEALRRMVRPMARVLRDGTPTQVPAADLVPGDVLELEAGDQVPADARLVRAFGLRAQEAALTGEAEPVDKDAGVVLEPSAGIAERRNLVHFGTVIVAGKGVAVVTRTGMATELGHIATLLQSARPESTPLQRRLDELGRVLVVVCLAIVAAIALTQWLRGGDPLGVFLLAVSLAVAAVPEGLPAVVTLALAIGLQRMAKRNALVRRLPAVETLGAVTVICTDKTGTLTRNEMTVRAIVAGDTAYRVGGGGYAPRGAIVRLPAPDALFEMDDPIAAGVEPAADADLLDALRIAAWCNHARLVAPVGDGEWSVIGDPTEAALKVAARKGGVDDPGPGVEPIHEIPFDAERRAMSIAWRDRDGRRWLTTKGAPEAILDRCTSERAGGHARALTPERRAGILALDARLAADALRVLAVASRELDSGDPIEERELVFAGLFAMLDPPRDEARAAVETCRASGIRPVMITGDHPATAIAIARALGIAAPGHVALTGRDLDRMDDDALERRVEGVSVYARVSAEHKLRVVRAWKARGQVVAMTGDGVNDAPAVQAADIGIAMGRTGTDVTREAADMVLLDDNFASIVSAVREGRGIFDNIRKFVHYLLATNAGEILLMFFAALVGWPAPLIAVQILWINLVTDGLPALALGVEPPERDIMERPPRSPREPVITPRGGVSVLVLGALVATVAAAGFVWAHGGDAANLGHARTVAFCVTAYAQLFYAFAFRSQTRTLPELGLFSNRPLLAAVAVAGLLQLAAVELPFTRPFFAVERPLASDWGVVLALALLPVTIVEVWKIVRAPRTRGRAGR